ncbi:hypothetical protein ABH978_005589 [Bradyrhizobium ottawaense]|uniref:hypothetical protein n=1 Tax=Bradyrhizobium ottawaense TaxID=931866 RepID=UPI0035187ACE
MHRDVLEGDTVDVHPNALGRFEHIGAGRDLAVDAMIAVVAGLLRIERRGDRGRVEIVDDDVGEVAGQLVLLARLRHVDGEDGAVRFHCIDLAALEILDCQPGIGDLAAAGGAAARIEGHRQRRSRD